MFFLDGYCGDLYPIVKLIKMFIDLIKFAVPIALIVFITIDFSKSVISHDEESMKKNQNIAIRRLIYAVAIFLVFSVVDLLMGVISEAGVNDLAGNEIDVMTWKACWQCKNKKTCDQVVEGGTSMCCATTNSGGNSERYTWYPSTKACPDGTHKVDRDESSCVGASNVSGICCSVKNNGKDYYTWYDSTSTCPEGTKVNSSKCESQGTCCSWEEDSSLDFKWRRFEWVSSGQCSSDKTAVNKKKSECKGSERIGVCCSKTNNDVVTYSWIWSSTCPDGSTKESLEKSKCSGTLN